MDCTYEYGVRNQDEEGPNVSNTTEQPTVELELCVRSLASPTDQERQEALLDRLEELAREDRISSFDITVWGDQIPLDREPRTATGRQLYRLLGTFERWADQPGRTIRPFFETRTRGFATTEPGRENQVLSLPAFALAEYHDGQLVWLSPHSRADSSHTVDDHLEAIPATESRSQLAEVPADDVASENLPRMSSPK